MSRIATIVVVVGIAAIFLFVVMNSGKGSKVVASNTSGSRGNDSYLDELFNLGTAIVNKIGDDEPTAKDEEEFTAGHFGVDYSKI